MNIVYYNSYKGKSSHNWSFRLGLLFNITTAEAVRLLACKPVDIHSTGLRVFHSGIRSVF